MAKLETTDVHDLETMIRYTLEWQDDIYVLAQRDGKWGSVPFAKLTHEQQAKHLAKWIEEGFIPARVLRIKEDA
jgi:hypothetical protein